MAVPLPADRADGALAAAVVALEARARAATDVTELAFAIANDAYAVLPFRQALVWAADPDSRAALTISGLARPTEDSPYLVWLRRTWRWLQSRLPLDAGWFAPGTGLPDDLVDGWREWWPTGIFAVPLRRRDGAPLAWACFLLDEPPPPPVAAALVQVGASWAYAWEMLAGRPTWTQRLPRLLAHRWRWVVVALLAALALPVRQSALAPAEVVALDAEVVAAPIDGVVRQVAVRPNQSVKAGQLLLLLDDTTLRNRLDVMRKAVAVADAELGATTQKAFDSAQSKGELGTLAGRAQERRAEMAATEAQLARVAVVAPRDGVAVFGDANDWIGRPVSTGERILLLADPRKPGVLIHLPAADAIALEVGSPVRLFLAAMPLSPLDAVVTETSYQALPSPDGVASYRLRAAFRGDAPPDAARIGLRGTARIDGDRVLLGFYLLRRPLSAMRQWTGW
jgi:multidrug resistance efflux pump